MSESRQRYNETFKREAVKYVQEQAKSLEEIAVELNINPGTLRNWVGKYREFENEPVNQGETLRQQSQVIDEQQREIEDLKEEIAILKKAMHIFSKERNKGFNLSKITAPIFDWRRCVKYCEYLGAVITNGKQPNLHKGRSTDRSFQSVLNGTSTTRMKLMAVQEYTMNL